MRSPLPTPGRNNLFDNLWNRLTGQKNTTSIQGTQRSRTSTIGLSRRDYDLEIREVPVRDPVNGTQLIEMRTWCPEIKGVLGYLRRDVFSSSDGDDIGWTVADTLDDNVTKINPNTKAIILDLIQRKNGTDRVVGGNKLKRAAKIVASDGDCFLELAIEREGISRGDYCVAKSMYLPTWEMFRCETDQGDLLGFEQRKRINDNDPIQLHPLKVVHFRYDQETLYGQSIFQSSIPDWKRLKDAVFDLSSAMRSLGCNPNLHVMQDGSTEEDKEAYKEDYRQLLDDGIPTDLFLMPGADVRKLGNQNPDLKTLIDNVQLYRTRLIPPGFPVWMFPGLDSTGAADIAGQPAKAYARLRNDLCGTISEGIRQIIDIELVLKLGWDEFQRTGQYRIVFPRFYVDYFQGKPIDEDEPNDRESEDLNSILSNGNGRKFNVSR